MKNYFSKIAENPGEGVTKEQISMFVTRYNFAAKYSLNKKIIEIACGPGIGLEYLSTVAKEVYAGDIDTNLLKIAKTKENEKIKILEIDAQNIPFENNSFDTVILLESIYFIPNSSLFLKEAQRILKKQGNLVLTFPNIFWSKFNKSPFAFKYYTVNEIRDTLNMLGFDTCAYVAFKDKDRGLKGRVIDVIWKFAVRYNLIPTSNELKSKLKKIFVGTVDKLPESIFPYSGTESEMIKLEDGQESPKEFRIIYIVGTLKTK